VDAYTSKEAQSWGGREDVRQPRRTPLSAYVSIRQHTSAYVSIRGCEAAEEDASISEEEEEGEEDASLSESF
jgi:hypothetical protein